VGDWQDTLQYPSLTSDGRTRATFAKIRFQVDQFTGHMLQHCHLLFHEDQGMMAQYDMRGDEGTTWDGARDIDRTCIKPTAKKGFNTTSQPSEQLSESPSFSAIPSSTPDPTPDPTPNPTDNPATDVLCTTTEAFTPPAGNLDATAIEVTTPASVTIDNVVCVAGEESTLKTSLQASLQAISCPTGSNYSVKVMKLECKSRRRQFRGLLSSASSSLVADFEVMLTVYCQTNDCSDANEVVQAVYGTVTDNFRAAIIDSSFITALQSSASSTAFASSSAGSDAVTFGQVVAPLLEALTDWYPSWHDQTSTCLNDGNVPAYMRNGNSFIRNSLEECCNWYYSWDFTNCMILSGASSSVYATNEFYIDYYSRSCRQSCIEGTAGLNCAGIAPNWVKVFATAESCCEQKLWWVETSRCVADSTLTPFTTAAGSSKWYRDGEKCVKDCDDSSDAQCGGLAERWEETFTTSGVCCSTTLWWVATEDCT